MSWSSFRKTLNPLPNDKMLNQSKFKTLADDNLYLAQTMEFVVDVLENIGRNGENAGYQHFLLFPPCFQMRSFLGWFQGGIVWKIVKRPYFH